MTMNVWNIVGSDWLCLFREPYLRLISNLSYLRQFHVRWIFLILNAWLINYGIVKAKIWVNLIFVEVFLRDTYIITWPVDEFLIVTGISFLELIVDYLLVNLAWIEAFFQLWLRQAFVEGALLRRKWLCKLTGLIWQVYALSHWWFFALSVFGNNTPMSDVGAELRSLLDTLAILGLIGCRIAVSIETGRISH